MIEYYPELIHRTFVLNTPTDFEEVWEEFIDTFEISQSTQSKFHITEKSKSKDLSDLVTDHSNLPKEYGGKAKWDPRGAFNDKGPWASFNDFMNYGGEENKSPEEEEPPQEDDEFDFQDEDNETGNFIQLEKAIQSIPAMPGHKKKNKFQDLSQKENEGLSMGQMDELTSKLQGMFQMGGDMEIGDTPNATPMNTQADEEI